MASVTSDQFDRIRDEHAIVPPFSSAHAALVFAYNFDLQQYAPSALATLMATPGIGGGKGLAGLDGAGQAGMILREVVGIGRGAEHFMCARFAPHSSPCECRSPCCSGQRRTRAWAEAVDWITGQCIGVLSGRMSNYRLRAGIVRRYFGERVTMSELATYSNVNRDTASDHNGRITAWLKHEENQAYHAAVAAIRAAGMAE